MMNQQKLHERIDEQINEAADRYDLTKNQLKYKAEIFKPDSPKIATSISTEIGWVDEKSGYTWSNHYFYSPEKFGYTQDTDLEKEIRKYLKGKKIKPF
ncbi:hypothetical protein ACFLZL_05495 [Thermodesulfobacteriota bacterium]